MEISYWRNKVKKQVETELFSSKADEIARQIHQDQVASKGKVNKPTQLRKFYDEVLRFDSMLKGLPDEKQIDEFARMLPYLKMLNAKASYAMGRDLVSGRFRDFIASSLSKIDDKDDFQAFAGLFEAFMGFSKFYDEKTENQTHGGRI